MTCELALALLLDAEPSEFSANERTPLGEHLGSCARCRRVAAQLMQDTQELAVAMEAGSLRRPGRRVRQLALIPAFATAATVFAVMLRERPPAPTIVHRVPEPVAVAAPSVAPSTESPAPILPGVVRSRQESVGRREMKAFARPVPLAPVRLAQSVMPEASRSVETIGVSVTPPAGTRATVMHTSNPKLTVVWLY